MGTVIKIQIIKLIGFIVLIVAISLPSQLIAQNVVPKDNDSLVMNTGDLIVGEIKGLEKAVLTIETDYSDSDFKVEWDKVIYIHSDRTFLINLSGGQRINGSIISDPTDSSMVLILAGMSVTSSDFLDVVYLKPVEQDFLGRLNASIGIGVTLTKSNNLKQLTSRSSLGYIANAWSMDASLDAIYSRQDSVADTKRTDASIGGRLILQRSWFVFLSSDFLKDDDYKLKLRATTNTGLGKYIVQSNKMYFAGGLGVAWNNESFTDASLEPRNSLESFLGMELNMFDLEDFSLQTTLNILPSITERGRIRTDFKIDLKYDLPLDFFIKLGYTHNFDNQPVTNASKHVYMFQTTFGWELD